MTIISGAAGCLTFGVLFVIVLFVGLGVSALLQYGEQSKAPTEAWIILAVFGAFAIALLAALGVCLALLNRRWWLKGPLIAVWPLYVWILTLAASTSAPTPTPSPTLRPEFYHDVSGDYLGLLSVIGATLSLTAITVFAAFLVRRSGRPTGPMSSLSLSSPPSYPSEAQTVPQATPEGFSPNTMRVGRGALVALGVVGFGISVITVVGLGNRVHDTTHTSTPAAPTATATSATAPGSSGPATSGDSCAPQPCATDDGGWIVSVSNIRFDMQSGNEFEKPQAGNVYVALDVTFTNKLQKARQADLVDFVLIDGSGIEQPITFVDTCAEWNPENVKPGTSYGPQCLVFEATAGKPSRLVLVWTSATGSAVYRIKVT